MEVVLVDREPRLGGVCLLRGCIPSKAMLHVAKTMAEAKHLASWGISFDHPAVDVEAFRTRKEKLIGTLSGGLKQLAARRKVKVVRARAVFDDSQTLRLRPVGDAAAEDDRIEFEHCIVATGSRATQLPDTQVPGVMDSSGALALSDVPESMLVVGGGYIGLELGTVYAALGSRVSVVELTDGLLPGVDRDLVKPLHGRLEKDFQSIHLNGKVVGMAAGDGAVEVTVEVTVEGEVQQQTQRFGRVLVAVGRRPNSAGLGLGNTRVEVDPQGFIVTDNRQRTADPHILAIGDVAGQPMLAHKATAQGRTAVEALCGSAAEFDPAAIPAVVFTDPEIAWTGLTETEARARGQRVEVARFPWIASGRAQAVGRSEGLTKWLIDPQSNRLLGCGIVGTGAGELIAEATLAIEMGVEAHSLAGTIHPHPTLSETLAAAAEVHLGTATDLYRPKRKR